MDAIHTVKIMMDIKVSVARIYLQRLKSRAPMLFISASVQLLPDGTRVTVCWLDHSEASHVKTVCVDFEVKL